MLATLATVRVWHNEPIYILDTRVCLWLALHGRLDGEEEMSIIDRIHKHLSVYNLALEGVPPFRITADEHKELSDLVDDLKPTCKCCEKKNGIISFYFGVPLEIVVLVPRLW